jgi:hypothetical protein
MSWFFSNNSNNSFNGNISIGKINMSGNTVCMNGVEYKNVSTITIETNGEKIKLEDKYVDLTIIIQGDMTQPMTLSNSKVVVEGDSSTISTSNASIHINGNCNGSATTSNGKMEVDGSVYGNAITSNGNINIKGICTGNTKTSNGKVTK